MFKFRFNSNSKSPEENKPANKETKPSKRRSLKILAVIGGVMTTATIGYLVVRAVTTPGLFSVVDTFETFNRIAKRGNLVIYGGQVKLPSPFINEAACNSVEGWYWLTTNGRGACWSRTLAGNVSWKKGGRLPNNTVEPGDYTCANPVSGFIPIDKLIERMTAATKGQWYNIVATVSSTPITSADIGQAGANKISALAIADCIDGQRDLCMPTDEQPYCLGDTKDRINSSLATWASTSGNKSALPYCVSGTCNNSTNDDYYNIYDKKGTPQELDSYNEVIDLPLRNKNQSTCEKRWRTNVSGDCLSGRANWYATVPSWTAAYYTSDSWLFDINPSVQTYIFGCGYGPCSSHTLGFRVVIRP